MLDSPVIYWNKLSLFPYSQLFLESRPLRFHNSVEIIIASEGSERALQIMDKILPPLTGDAPSSYWWSLQSNSLLGDWSYLPMGMVGEGEMRLSRYPRSNWKNLMCLKSSTEKSVMAHKWQDILEIIPGPPSWRRNPLLLNPY